jgi:trehalose 6-phosphate phosphatase
LNTRIPRGEAHEYIGAPPPLAGDEAAVFLDLDGTLAEIAQRPDEVKPAAGRTLTLKRLHKRVGGRLAVLTGRDLSEADRILEGTVVAIGAVHGHVRRSPEGDVSRSATSPSLHLARTALRALADGVPGLVFEDKDCSVAVHYRQAPDDEALVEEVVSGLAEVSDLVLQEGSMVFELRAPGPDKGDALRAFMAEAPFRGAVPVMIGDDLTDEHGFEAAKALGGYGVLVGPLRPTAASYRLDSVADVLAWLDEAARR